MPCASWVNYSKFISVDQSLHCGCHGHPWKNSPHQCQDRWRSWGNCYVLCRRQRIYNILSFPFHPLGARLEAGWVGVWFQLLQVHWDRRERQQSSGTATSSSSRILYTSLLHFCGCLLLLTVGGQYPCLLLLCAHLPEQALSPWTEG